MKILHIIGGDLSYGGAAKGALILHNALFKAGINSSILNDTPTKNNYKNITYINQNFFSRLKYKAFVVIEKILKSIFLHSPRETFTIGLFGFDITKIPEYKNADIIHLHWLNQGFIRLSCLSKINKPVIWTIRDMWVFTGGSHYTMDFEKYENSKLSKIIQNYKKKNYKKNFQFITISDWLKDKAKSSEVLKEFNVKRIYNNIDLNSFETIDKKNARLKLKINTSKKIILYGANNPQSKRKGWEIFVNSLKKIDKSKYFLLIFGNFWSKQTLDEIEIDYKSLGFINDKKILNYVYACADLFVASSIQDGWPKTFAEALYCNTPVVCFSNTSIAEIVDHKVNGYVVDNFDSGGLKDGIDWVSRNQLNLEKAKFKITEFGSDKIAKKYIEVYKNVLYKN